MRTPLGTSSTVACIVACIVACSGALPHPPYVQQPTSALVPVPAPPPPARVEVVPDAPAKGAVWVDGQWIYRRGRWAWQLGRWVVAGEGRRFSPPALVRTADGTLYYAPGVWRDAQGAAVDPPPALAWATAQTGPVVDAEGYTEITGRTVRVGAGAGAPAITAPGSPAVSDAGPRAAAEAGPSALADAAPQAAAEAGPPAEDGGS